MAAVFVPCFLSHYMQLANSGQEVKETHLRFLLQSVCFVVMLDGKSRDWVPVLRLSRLRKSADHSLLDLVSITALMK